LDQLSIRTDAVVPLTMKLRRDYVDARKLFIADFYSGFVVAFIQSRPYQQPGLRGRVGDEIDDHPVTGQRTTAPVLGDKAEQTVFDLVPLARARRKVADLQAQLQLVRQILQSDFPQPVAAAVTAAAVGGNHQFRSPRKPPYSHLQPPASNAGRGELRRVVIDSHAHPTFVAGQVVNPVRDRLAQFLFRSEE